MRKFSIVLVFLLCASQTAARAACATPPPMPIPQMPPILPGIGVQSYYCAASPAVSTVGDLTPAEWIKHVQICTTNCSYEPIVPGDPQSRLMPVGCGTGWHGTAYLVEPPQPASLKAGLVDSCKGLVPPKAPAPAPSPPGEQHMR